MNYFILEVPRWKGEIIFNYETVSFIMIWIVLLSSIMLCILGYKYFRSMCLLIIGSMCGVGANIITERITDNLVLKMILFVIIVFFSIYFFYFLSTLLGKKIKFLGKEKTLSRLRYLFSPIIGGIVAGITVYHKIYHNLWIVIGATFILCICSILNGRKRVAQQKPFYCYDDLCKLEPLTEVQKDA